MIIIHCFCLFTDVLFSLILAYALLPCAKVYNIPGCCADVCYILDCCTDVYFILDCCADVYYILDCCALCRCLLYP